MGSVTYTTVELLTPKGPEFRRVSTAPPRPATDEEIPRIDLSAIDGDLESRKAIAVKIREAAMSTGFIYIHNHGIPEELIQGALTHVKEFFDQPLAEKEKVKTSISGKSVGYTGVGRTQINKTETRGTFSPRKASSSVLTWCRQQGDVLHAVRCPQRPIARHHQLACRR